MIHQLEHLNVGCGVVLNAILLYLIRRFSRVELGTYKYLLATFAVFDIALSLLHATTNPKIVSIDYVFGAVTHTRIESVHLTCLYFACFAVPFALLNIHFLYRYLTIKHPTLIELFWIPKYIAVLSSYPIGQTVVWYVCALSLSPDPEVPVLPFLREAFHTIYNDTVVDGWLIMDYWRDGQLNIATLSGICPAFLIMGASFAAATYLAWGAYRGIVMTDSLSHTYRQFQFQILYTACVQTVVPLLLVCLPYFCIIFFPFAGIPSSGVNRIFPVLISLFPAWDAVVITLLIKDYRWGLLQVLHLWRSKIAVASKHTDMTATTWAVPREADN